MYIKIHQFSVLMKGLKIRHVVFPKHLNCRDYFQELLNQCGCPLSSFSGLTQRTDGRLWDQSPGTESSSEKAKAENLTELTQYTMEFTELLNFGLQQGREVILQNYLSKTEIFFSYHWSNTI